MRNIPHANTMQEEWINLVKKTMFILVVVVWLFASAASAQEALIINDDGVNETLYRDDFTLPATNHIFMDMPKIHTLLERLRHQVKQEPVDAKLDANMQIIPEIPGKTLHTERFMSIFQAFLYHDSGKKITVPMKAVYPRVDSELLSNIRTNKIGSYATRYREGNKERSHNIKLAAEAINNHVLFPGEIFSFNKVVGKRTKQRGYQKAPVIVKGELSEDIGGGICQVSSTLFNAVNLQGVQIVERYSHSREVPYVPPGKDATVSWWGPDFVFKNKYKQPILVRAQAGNGNMIVEIYGPDALAKEIGK